MFNLFDPCIDILVKLLHYSKNIGGNKTLESNNNYQSVFVTVKLTGEANRLLTESSKRSNRKKIQEATLRLEDHLKRFRSISELDHVVHVDKQKGL